MSDKSMRKVMMDSVEKPSARKTELIRSADKPSARISQKPPLKK